MKLPSLTTLIHGATATLARFPFVLLAATVATIATIIGPDDIRSILASVLGIPLFFSIALFGERRGWSAAGKIGGGIAGVVLLVGYYFMLAPGGRTDANAIQFVVLGFVLHFLVAVAPYLVRNQIHGFWQYNKALFLRALASLLYTGVLYIGLSLALLAVVELFQVKIDWDIYSDLGAVLLGIFNTWFFLAGVPHDFVALQEDSSYPGGLKVFTQYVLLPLVVVYLGILYLYAGKIILEWNWPNGWVSSLILGFSVAGILSALLLYPVREQEGNTWISRFYSGFYYALLPLTVLLVLAAWRRVSEYGITEGRYYVIALALWLAAIAIYMLATRGRDIKAIPVSLAVLGLFSVFGPWGALQVSTESQIRQLREVLERDTILVNDRVGSRTFGANSDAINRARSIIYYLDERNKLGAIAPWFGVGSDTVGLEDIFKPLGIEYYPTPSYGEGEPNPVTFSADEPSAINIAGYERLLRYTGSSYGNRSDVPQGFELGGDTLALVFTGSSGMLQLLRGSEVLVEMDLNGYAGNVRQALGEQMAYQTVPIESLTVAASGKGFRMNVQILSLSTDRGGIPTGPVKVSMFSANVMVARQDSTQSGVAATMPQAAGGVAKRP